MACATPGRLAARSWAFYTHDSEQSTVGRLPQTIIRWGQHGNLRKFLRERHFSNPQILQEFRRRLDAAHEQIVPGARAGDVEQVPLGVVDLLQVGVVANGLDSLL